MSHLLCAAAASAAPYRLASALSDRAAALLAAASHLLPFLEAGRTITSGDLRAAMMHAFGGSDAEGLWDWKSAYDACEAAQILFLRKFGPAIIARAPQQALALMERIAALLPSHTRRSPLCQTLQQFSTPAGLAYVASCAAAMHKGDHVLEPSAGTGMLAIHAALARAGLTLNELAETRAALLARLFPDIGVSHHDGASIDDRLAT